MAKFVANNNKSAFIKLFLFFTFQDLYFYISFDIIDFSNANICKRINKQKVLDPCKNIEIIWKFV